jgi:glutamine amidotransferase
MLRGIDDPIWVYFVHSYAAELTDDVVATCDYGAPLTAAVERDRLWATQFHPEKSGATGMAILKQFVDSL